LISLGTLAVTKSDGTLLEGTFLVHPRADKPPMPVSRTQGFVADVALLKFPEASFETFKELYSGKVEKDQEVEIVGFGYDKVQNFISRQYGSNRIHAVIDDTTLDPNGKDLPEFYDSMIWLRYDRELNHTQKVNSGTSSGDSGGPLLIGGKVAGVLYGGASWRKDLTAADQARFKDSIYVNLRSKVNIEFLESARSQGWDVPKTGP
jgi:hypothetical protein